MAIGRLPADERVIAEFALVDSPQFDETPNFCELGAPTHFVNTHDQDTPTEVRRHEEEFSDAPSQRYAQYLIKYGHDD